MLVSRSSSFGFLRNRILNRTTSVLVAPSIRQKSIQRQPSTFHVTQLQSARDFATLPRTSNIVAKPWKEYKPESAESPQIYCFLERSTESCQFLVVDPATSEAVIIDPVLDYEAASATVSTKSADEILSFTEEEKLKVTRILETHAHADHLTSSQYLKQKLGGIPVCIGTRITKTQKNFSAVYGLEPSELSETFDVYLKDDEIFNIGNLSCLVVHLPGHTLDHVGFVVGKAVFVGDSVFMPDIGSARADFPGGSAHDLWVTMQKLMSLPEDYQLFVGHDYPSGREHNCLATVRTHKKTNKHTKDGVTKEEFIKAREARDSALGKPRLIHPSLQINIRAGKLPLRDEQGRLFLKVPLKTNVQL